MKKKQSIEFLNSQFRHSLILDIATSIVPPLPKEGNVCFVLNSATGVPSCWAQASPKSPCLLY